jgi:hypothetical protein
MESTTENRADLFLRLGRNAEFCQHAWVALGGGVVRKCEKGVKVRGGGAMSGKAKTEDRKRGKTDFKRQTRIK